MTRVNIQQEIIKQHKTTTMIDQEIAKQLQKLHDTDLKDMVALWGGAGTFKRQAGAYARYWLARHWWYYARYLALLILCAFGIVNILLLRACVIATTPSGIVETAGTAPTSVVPADSELTAILYFDFKSGRYFTYPVDDKSLKQYMTPQQAHELMQKYN